MDENEASNKSLPGTQKISVKYHGMAKQKQLTKRVPGVRAWFDSESQKVYYDQINMPVMGKDNGLLGG